MLHSLSRSTITKFICLEKNYRNSIIGKVLNNYFHGSVSFNDESHTYRLQGINSNEANFVDFKNNFLSFVSSENIFSHSVLEKKSYSVTDLDLPIEKLLTEIDNVDVDKILQETDWNRIYLTEFCKLFRIVSIDAGFKRHHLITHKMYNGMCEGLINRSSQLTDKQLERLLYSLKYWPKCSNYLDSNFYNVWRILDDECYKRKFGWDIDKTLYFIDLWFAIRLVGHSNFASTSVVNLGKRSKILTSSQFIQMLFYFNILRKITDTFSSSEMFKIESKLEDALDSLSLEEIGVASISFFKTQTSLKNETLIRAILERTIRDLKQNNINEITVVCILKILRFSMRLSLCGDLHRFLDVIVDYIDQFSLKASIHAALLLTSFSTLHPPILCKVSQKLVDSIQTSRLKDIEKIIYPLTSLRFNPKTKPCVFETIINEIQKVERVPEWRYYQESIIAILHYLALNSIYPSELISSVLEKQFLDKMFERNPEGHGRHLLSLDTCIEIECPSYQGSRLSADLRLSLARKYSRLPHLLNQISSKHEIFMNEVVNLSQSLIGKDFIDVKYIIPHHPRADIIFRKDSSGDLNPIPRSYKILREYNGPIWTPKDGKIWSAIVLCTKNMCIENTKQPNGETVAKLRLLKKLGYEPHLIKLIEWPKDNETKIHVLKQIFFKYNLFNLHNELEF